MKNVTTRRLGSFTHALFKSSSWRVWRSTKEPSSWKVVVQDLAVIKTRRHAELVSGFTSGVVCRTGFTLIELLVVVLIIGILAAVALPQYTKAVTKSRFTEAMSNLKTIAQADRVCRLAKGGDEPCFMDELDISIAGSKEEEFVETKDFYYYASSGPGSIPSAQYKKEGVCLCYLDSGEFVVWYDETCINSGVKHSMDYAKLLNVKASTDDDPCCCC